MAIISFKHKFIFIKTTKTGGTSIEVDLSRIAGPDAIVTPIIPAIMGHEPRNFEDEDRNPLYFNHMSAREIQALLGKEEFSDFYRFTVEREPIDKCLSHFHMIKNRDDAHGLPAEEREALTWEAYVERGRFPIDLGKYADPQNPGRMLVNEVLAYESMHATLRDRLERCGVSQFELTTRAKSEYRKARHLERADVTPAQARTIYTAFEASLELTGLYKAEAEQVLRP